MKGKIPFEEEFKKDEREIVLGCFGDRGLIQLFGPRKGNFLSISVHWDGKIEISTCGTFPRASLRITTVGLRREGEYDRIQLEANLEGE